MTDEFKNLEMAEYGDQDINEYWTAAIRGAARQESILELCMPTIPFPQNMGEIVNVPYEGQLYAEEYPIKSLIQEFRSEELEYVLNQQVLTKIGIKSVFDSAALATAPDWKLKRNLGKQYDAVARKHNSILVTAANAVFTANTGWHYDVETDDSLSYNDLVGAATTLHNAGHYCDAKYPYVVLVSSTEAIDLAKDDDIHDATRTIHADPKKELIYSEEKGRLLFDLDRPYRMKVYEVDGLTSGYAAMFDPANGAAYVQLKGFEGIRSTEEMINNSTKQIKTQSIMTFGFLDNTESPTTTGDTPGFVTIDVDTSS